MHTFKGALATGLVAAGVLGAMAITPALAASAAAPAPASKSTAYTAAANADNGSIATTTKTAPASTTMQSTKPAPQAMKTSAKATMSRTHVEHIQTALSQGGEHIAIDGVWGPKTTAAVKEFQKTHDLKVTGHLDTETLKALPKTA
ncbi:MAG TPA: peptidoglycan-binding domain-containing protein [Magnetospirillaceae bacterium]|jgi:peptidoglycan hydrolase-like protein with peptidoglycan-binding domain